MEPLATENFDQHIQGKQTGLFILKNSSGTSVALTNYGARIVSIIVLDAKGNSRSVVVGFKSIMDYLNATEIYHGAIIGRYANRIAKGEFILDKKRYILNINNEPNHLHGGKTGFHNVVWEVEKHDKRSLILNYFSKDGEEGYPGNLAVRVIYKLEESNSLNISFTATTDKTTIINLTNHAYFNLNGIGNGSILDHQLKINADFYTPIDETSIPLGILEPVADTPFDFRTAKIIGQHIQEEHQQLINGSGYDHNYALNKRHENERTLAASAIGDLSGITMDVLTTEPGVQLYTGNFMQGSNTVNGAVDEHRSAFCLETQHFPDSPNHSSFPSTTLTAGSTYTSETTFRFSAKRNN